MTSVRTLEQPEVLGHAGHHPYRRSLVTGEVLLGVAAVVGTVQLATGLSTPPDGDLPFGLSSWVLPAVWLFGMVAVPSLLAAGLLALRNVHAPAAVWVASVLLGAELLAQVPFLGPSVLQAICGGVGMSLAVLAGRARALGWGRR